MGKVIYGQSGYIGSSMSVRASLAYDAGEMPLSKWTKEEMLAALPDALASQLAKHTARTLRDNVLECAGWHHTGKYANKTDFYRVKDPEDIRPESIVPSAPQKKAKPEEDPLYYHGYFIEKRFHPYSRWHRVEEIRHDFKNARRVGNWLDVPYMGRKRFDLCTVERTTKRKIK